MVVLDTLEDLLTHTVYSSGAWCKDYVMLFYGGVDALDFMGAGWSLAFPGFIL